MKIQCPSCKLTGNIDDATVPATGLAMNCPRCKTNFTAERPSAASGPTGAMMDSCPSCQYATFSEEKFAVCPKCGLVVADYHKKQLASRQAGNSRPREQVGERRVQEQPLPPVRLSEEQRRKEGEARRKYGLDKVPGSIDQAEPEKLKAAPAETPLAVMVIGWVTVVAALALVVFGITGVLEFTAKLKEAKAALLAGDEARPAMELFFSFALFPVLMILYSLVMMVFASQFLSFRRWSIKALEKGALVGVALAASMEISDMIGWCKRASSNASIGYYATGLIGGLLMAALWIVPLIALSEYLRCPQFEKIKNNFG